MCLKFVSRHVSLVFSLEVFQLAELAAYECSSTETKIVMSEMHRKEFDANSKILGLQAQGNQQNYKKTSKGLVVRPWLTKGL